MAKSEDRTDESRRNFLKLTATAPAVAAAAALGGTAGTAEAAAPKAGGMQDTPHTRAYFDSCRF